MDEKEYRIVIPYGKLFTHNRSYFLLKPSPIPGDSWEKDNAYRWYVVPDKDIGFEFDKDGNQINHYSFGRHIVSTSFTVEYSSSMPAIKIWRLEQIDVEDLIAPSNSEYEPTPAETGWLHNQLHLQGVLENE